MRCSGIEPLTCSVLYSLSCRLVSGQCTTSSLFSIPGLAVIATALPSRAILLVSVPV